MVECERVLWPSHTASVSRVEARDGVGCVVVLCGRMSVCVREREKFDKRGTLGIILLFIILLVTVEKSQLSRQITRTHEARRSCAKFTDLVL